VKAFENNKGINEVKIMEFGVAYIIIFGIR